MSKTDLAARPMFARKRDAIEAHLTIVFTALAVAPRTQTRSGLAIRNLVRKLRPLRSATITINGAVQTFPPAISPEQQAILDALAGSSARHQPNQPTQARRRPPMGTPMMPKRPSTHESRRGGTVVR